MTETTAPIILTDRERGILSGYAHGWTDRVIAHYLREKSGKAVASAGRRMRVRMGAANRAHAVGIAYRTGILKAGQP